MQYNNNTKDTQELLKIFYSDKYGFDEEGLKKVCKEFCSIMIIMRDINII